MKNHLVLSLVFLLLAVAFVLVKRTYFSIPVNELKRRAKSGDHSSAFLYKAVTYGNSLRALLWLLIGVFTATSLILISRDVNFWLSLLIVALLLYLIFSFLPSKKSSQFGLLLTRLLAPLIVAILKKLYLPLSRVATKLGSHYISGQHTGLYERSDILDLIKRQQKQPDNRLTSEEVEIIKRAVKFNEKKVTDILIPKKDIKTVLASDTVGPILINELHESNQADVLVKESSRGEIVGSLAFRDLGIRSQGKVGDLMNDQLYYLNEDDSLSEALHAFFVTNHHIFIVISNNQEYLGIVTIEAMLKELLGHIPGDEFDAYKDKDRVANRYNFDQNNESTVQTDEEMLE